MRDTLEVPAASQMAVIGSSDRTSQTNSNSLITGDTSTRSISHNLSLLPVPGLSNHSPTPLLLLPQAQPKVATKDPADDLPVARRLRSNRRNSSSAPSRQRLPDSPASQKARHQLRDPLTGAFIRSTSSDDPSYSPSTLTKRNGSFSLNSRKSSRPPPRPFEIPFLYDRNELSDEDGRSMREKRKRTREEAEHEGDEDWKEWKENIGIDQVLRYDEVDMMGGRGALRRWGWWKEKGSEQTNEEHATEEGRKLTQRDDLVEAQIGLNQISNTERQRESNGIVETMGVVSLQPSDSSATFSTQTALTFAKAVVPRLQAPITQTLSIVGDSMSAPPPVSSKSKRKRKTEGSSKRRPSIDYGTRTSTRIALKQATAPIEEEEEEDCGKVSETKDQALPVSKSSSSSTFILPKPAPTSATTSSSFLLSTAVSASFTAPTPIPSVLKSEKTPSPAPSASPLPFSPYLPAHGDSPTSESTPKGDESFDSNSRTEDEEEVLMALLDLSGSMCCQKLMVEVDSWKIAGEGGKITSEEGEDEIRTNRMEEMSEMEETEGSKRSEDASELAPARPATTQQSSLPTPSPDVNQNIELPKFDSRSLALDPSLQPVSSAQGCCFDLVDSEVTLKSSSSSPSTSDYVPPSPVSPETSFSALLPASTSTNALSFKPRSQTVHRSDRPHSTSAISALANKPQLFTSKIEPLCLVLATLRPSFSPGGEECSVKTRENGSGRMAEVIEAKREEVAEEANELKERLWRDCEDGDGGKLDLLYCPNFLASKIARLNTEDPDSPLPSFDSPSTSAFLSLLRPSLGRPPLQNLPSTKSDSSVPVSNETFPAPSSRISSALEYLYNRSFLDKEIEYFQANEPSFWKFIETMIYVAEINEKIDDLDSQLAERNVASIGTEWERSSPTNPRSVGGRRSSDQFASSPARGGVGNGRYRRKYGAAP